MYCSKCGSQISDEAVICIHCGVPVKPMTAAERTNTSNPLALVGFILSFFLTLPALICSAIAYRRCKENPDLEGKGMSLAGIIISSIKIGLVVLAFLFWFVICVILMGSIGRYGM